MNDQIVKDALKVLRAASPELEARFRGVMLILLGEVYLNGKGQPKTVDVEEARDLFLVGPEGGTDYEN